MNATNIRILIVDDFVSIRQGMADLLGRETDIEVVGEACTGEKAVRMARRLIPDVVVTDYKMPGMNGIMASRQMLHENPNTKILLMSACLSGEIIEKALKAGIAGLMSKDVAYQELADAIYAVHKGEQFCCPMVRQMQEEGVFKG